MKYITSAGALLGLATLSTAAPTKRQNTCILDTVQNPGTDAVKLSIGQWNVDVLNVNNFLNQAPHLLNSSSTLASEASSALQNAQDEPCQLMTLASIASIGSSVDAFTCAVDDLMDVFQTHVLDNLNTIIANPSNANSVMDAVQDINNFRCCNVLGDASILWQDAAENFGLGGEVNTVAPFPNACASISCSNRCSAEDNSSFGTPGDAVSPAK